MDSYVDRLLNSAERVGHLLCLGLDPVPEKVAQVMGSGELGAAEDFLEEILQALSEQNLLPSALKPNLAYFEQYGPPGLELLRRMIKRWQPQCLIICDAKRGDIGRSSLAYARAFFEFYGADAVTVSPWMGRDSLEPFVQYGPIHGTYALLRTSNPGHADLQARLWEPLARNFHQWGGAHLGAVVGATSPDDLSLALELVGERPLLIPGVGTQGGDAHEVMTRLKSCPRPGLHRVNVSSGILYAGKGKDYAYAALEATARFSKSLAL